MDAVTLKLAKKYADAVLGSSAGIEMRVDAGNVEWRQAGGAWAILIPVTDLMGPGVPVGGSTGQALVKSSAADGDTEWATPFDGDYGSLTNKPTLGTAAAEDVGAFAAAAHTHAIADATDVDTTGITLGQTLVWDGSEFTPGSSGAGDMLKSVYDSVGNGIVNEARAVAWSGVSSKPSTFTPSSHSHDMGDVTGLTGALSGKADTSHTHDQGDITGLTSALSGKADVSHTHAAGDIASGTLSVARGGTGASTLTSGSFLQGNGAGAVTTRTPGQVLSDIGAAAASHNHSAADINSGTLGVARGGTGASTLTSGSFLRGNGTSAVQLRTPAQVKSDIDAMDKHFVVNNQTGASYTLALADDGALVTRNNSSANTLTIPTNASVAFPVGTVINFVQIGAGVTTVVAASGVTVNGVSAGSAAVTKRYSVGSLVKTATNSWILSGPVEDVS